MILRFEGKKISGDAFNYDVYFYDVLAEDGKIVGPAMGNSALMKETAQVTLRTELRPLAAFLHPESPNFSASAYLEAFHDPRTPKFTSESLSKIKRYCSANANAHVAATRNNAGQVVNLFLANNEIELTFTQRSGSFRELGAIEQGLTKFNSDFALSASQIFSAKSGFFIMEEIADHAKLLDTHLVLMQTLHRLRKVRNFDLIATNLHLAAVAADTKSVFGSLTPALKRDLANFLDELNTTMFDSYSYRMPLETLKNTLSAQIAANKALKKDPSKIALRVFEQIAESLSELMSRAEAKNSASSSRAKIASIGYVAFFVELERPGRGEAKESQAQGSSRASFFSNIAAGVRQLVFVAKHEDLAKTFEHEVSSAVKHIITLFSTALQKELFQLQNPDRLRQILRSAKEARKSLEIARDELCPDRSSIPIGEQYVLESASSLFSKTENFQLPESRSANSSALNFLIPKIQEFLGCLSEYQIARRSAAPFLNKLLINFARRLAALGGPRERNHCLALLLTIRFCSEEFVPVLPSLLANSDGSAPFDVPVLAPALEAFAEAAKRLEADFLASAAAELSPLLTTLHYSCLSELPVDPEVSAEYKSRAQTIDFPARVALLAGELRYALSGSSFFLEPRSASMNFLESVCKICCEALTYSPRLAKRVRSNFLDLALSETRAHLRNVPLIKDYRVRCQNAFETELILYLLDLTKSYANDARYQEFKNAFSDLDKQKMDTSTYPKYLMGKLSYAKVKYSKVFNFSSLNSLA